MPQVELTDRFCQTAKPKTGSQAEFFDTIVKGLSLLTSKGGTKAFYVNYTGSTGKRARMKLGRYPEMTLSKAREKAREARGNIGEGKDPLVEKRSYVASQSVSDLIDNYVSRHAMTKRTGPAIARRLRYNVASQIGDIKLSDLHRRDITGCLDRIKDRGADVEANRVFEDLRAMIRWARGRGDLDVNLVEGMRKPSETVERDRVLSAIEVSGMWKSLPAADMREPTRRIIRLCLVTAQRVGEVAGMARKEIDFGRKVWTIPAARSKNGREHVVPLSDMAIAIINEQVASADAQAGRKERSPSDYIFPAPRGSRPSMAGAAAAKAIKKAEVNKDGTATILGVAPFTPHDLRRTAATHMEGIGISPFIIGHVLNHVSATKASITSRVYARYSYDKEKREALDLWADQLSSILSHGDSVIPLVKRGAAQ